MAFPSIRERRKLDPTMPRSCRVRLLGRFAVEFDGRAVPAAAWRHRRGSDLVKLLALATEHRLHREQVMEALWPELPADAQAANLRKAVHFARRTLGAEDAIVQEGPALRLGPEGVHTDVASFERAARAAIAAADSAEADRAARLYEGDLLPEDPYAPWAEEHRRRLHLLHLQVLKAAERWDRVLDLDRADEQAHRALMQRAFDAGDRQGAMRQFERLREALHEELGVGPDQRSVALYEEILAAEGGEPPTPAERTRALLAEGLLHWNRMELDDARHAAEPARALAVEAGLGRELGEASGLLGMIAHAQGRWRDLFRAEFMETLKQTPDLASFVFDAHLCLAEFSMYGSDGPAEAASFARELLRIAERRRSVHGKGLATLMLGEAELFSGRLEDAATDLRRAEDLHERAGAVSGQALSLERRAEVELAGSGGRTRAARLLHEALGLARTSTIGSHLLVRVWGAMIRQPRDPERAAEVAEDAERDLSRQEACQPCSMGFLVAAAVARARAGDPAGASRHLEQAERIAGMWQGGPWQAATWEARGELRRAEGDLAQAQALFREAAARFSVTGRVLDEARCRAEAEHGDAASSARPSSGNGTGTPAP